MTLRKTTQGSVPSQDDKMISQPSSASASTMITFSTREPVVRATSPMPPGYVFVNKGNPYLTRNCRRLTQLANQVVYAVINDAKKQVGIRVPSSIYSDVLKSERETRLTRREKVKKRDEAVEECLSQAIRKLFPRLPDNELRPIMRRATAKRQGRVGRTGKLTMAEKARLAVQAHVRHTKTTYENLLRSGVSRESARSMISSESSKIMREWGMAPRRRPAEKLFDEKMRDKSASLKDPISIAKTKPSKPVTSRMLAAPNATSEQKTKAKVNIPGKPVQAKAYHARRERIEELRRQKKERNRQKIERQAASRLEWVELQKVRSSQSPVEARLNRLKARNLVKEKEVSQLQNDH
ncbi:hypothetical protein F5Y03DRAFT_246777 [Xylaria venustula]|nr:hypothetical protein F5Y03DRAFT_246777 [Xylaria venustula]